MELSCEHCKNVVKSEDKYCHSCGVKLELERLLIFFYYRYSKGYPYKAIVAFLENYHDICLSERGLKRRLKDMNLRRYHDASTVYDERLIKEKIQQKIQSSGCLYGYRRMWQYLKSQGIFVPRRVVAKILKEVDNNGTEIRRRQRLRRRQYRSPGPNFCWHADGYDKIKPYGFPIHGCIDGYSRKIIWLKLTRSNNNPNAILQLYLDAVQKFSCSPTKLRTDCGTENVLMAAAQCYFTKSSESHIYGTSPHNQRIEAWWSQLRKGCMTWWINFFRDLVETERFTPGHQLQEEALWYSFHALIQQELDEFKENWNTHYIRKSRYDTVSGQPDMLYFLPQLNNAEEYKVSVNQSDYEEVWRQMELDNRDNSYQVYFDHLTYILGLTDPGTWQESLNMYDLLLRHAASESSLSQ